MKFNKFISIIIIFIILVSYLLNLINSNTYATTQIISSDIDKIDESKYPGVKKLIKKLQASHPNWTFKVLYTNLNWNTVIANEYVGHGGSPRNLVPANNSNYSGDWICSICGTKTYDSGSWVCASESAIKYMMDPRNSLNDTDIFQFQELSYDGYDSTTIDNMVKGTFLDKTAYKNTIKEAAEKYDVSPYYLVARILQEQGTSGTVLTNGKGYNGQYVGYYNVFNIGASGSSKSSVILNGLKTASANGWTSLSKSIRGGTEEIAKNYIARGQNTLYFQKFDVENSDNTLYYHQYMQNILAAQKEGETLRKTYTSVNSIDGAYTFIIPLYENMSETVSNRPSTTTTTAVSTDLVRVNVNNKIRLRKTANGSTTVDYLYKDEIVTRLEKATEKINGTYWDKVMKSNGVIGYVARETYDTEDSYKLYLVPITTTTTTNSNDTNNTSTDNLIITTNSKAKLDKSTSIVTIIPGTKVFDIVSLIGSDTVVKDSNGNTLSTSVGAGTGYRVNDMYTIALLGDINGDGTIDSGDLLLMKKYLLGTYKVEKVSAKVAIDVNSDGNVNSGDLLAIKKHLLGTSKISL